MRMLQRYLFSACCVVTHHDRRSVAVLNVAVRSEGSPRSSVPNVLAPVWADDSILDRLGNHALMPMACPQDMILPAQHPQIPELVRTSFATLDVVNVALRQLQWDAAP